MLERLGRPVEVALVNNMPAGAFEETGEQFERWLRSGAGPRSVAVARYCMPGNGGVAGPCPPGYRPLGEIYRRPPDALVVTGAEPVFADLRMETYWEALEALLRWAEHTVPSVLLSCLASHAAVLVFDGIERRPLPEKLSGVFEQRVRRDSPLSQGLTSFVLPHSRRNDVPTAILESHGYLPVVSSPRAGWSVATRMRGSCLVVLLQGHPEYSRETLLREYRRDLRRYGQGCYERPPAIPVGYLDAYGVELLDRFGAEVIAGRAAAGVIEQFPFQEAAAHIAPSWESPARRLVGNWLRSIDHDRGRSGVVGAGAGGRRAPYPAVPRPGRGVTAGA